MPPRRGVALWWPVRHTRVESHIASPARCGAGRGGAPQLGREGVVRAARRWCFARSCATVSRRERAGWSAVEVVRQAGGVQCARGVGRISSEPLISTTNGHESTRIMTGQLEVPVGRLSFQQTGPGSVSASGLGQSLDSCPLVFIRGYLLHRVVSGRFSASGGLPLGVLETAAVTVSRGAGWDGGTGSCAIHNGRTCLCR